MCGYLAIGNRIEFERFQSKAPISITQGEHHMGRNQNTASVVPLFSAEVGQGGCRIISSEIQSVITFEPVLAPETDRRGIVAQETRPRFTLFEDGHCTVFGIDDVFAHGRRTAIRRLNSMERYTTADYSRLFQVLLHQAFTAYHNTQMCITPVGIVAVPIIVYNNEAIINEMRNSLVRQYAIQDGSENILLVELQTRRLQLVPESYGTLMHYAFDPCTL